MFRFKVRSVQDVVLTFLEVFKSNADTWFISISSIDECNLLVRHFMKLIVAVILDDTLSTHDQLQVRVLDVFDSKLLFMLMVALFFFYFRQSYSHCFVLISNIVISILVLIQIGYLIVNTLLDEFSG